MLRKDYIDYRGRGTMLYDCVGLEVKVGDKVQLILDDGEERVFDVQIKTIERDLMCYAKFDDEYARKHIPEVVFCWNGYKIFSCVCSNGISPVNKMRIIG